MGGKGSSKIEVNNYQMSLHLGLCLSPVDAITAAYYGEKLYWSGYNTNNATYYIAQPSLFGGNKKEGGIQGNMTFLMGKSNQVIPDWFAQKLGRPNGASAPGFRGIASVVHNGPAPGGKPGWLWCSNSPYLKSMWYTVIAIPRSLESSMAQIGRLNQGKTSLYFCLDTSGSMATNNRMGILKNAMAIVLTNLRNALSGGNFKLDIGISHFGGFGMTFRNATVGNIDSLAAMVQSWEAGLSDTNFLTAITPAVNWFESTSGDSEITSRINLFVTDGEPFPEGTDVTAQALAKPLLDRTIPVDMCGINIDLYDTQYTAKLDNTPGDGVPVVTSDDPSGLVNAVMRAVFNNVDANPAHIIFEVLVNPSIGMGLDPTTAINIESFNKAAKTLYEESLGLSMAWSTSTSAEDFINEVKEHINGVIFPDPETGKITLKLIRDDYDKSTLRQINQDNANVTSFGRKAWGDTINEIVVTWTNPASESEETVTLQDNGNIAEQGEIVSDAKNYYGVRSSGLAWTLAARDLRVASSPLSMIEAELDRSFWNIKPGDCVSVTWEEYGISNLVMRVWEVKYGKRNSSKIVVSLTEDVFSLPVSAFVQPPSTEWTDPSQEPKGPTASAVITLPPYVVAAESGSGLGSFQYPVAYAGVLADDPNGDTDSFDLLAETHDVTGQVSWESRGRFQTSGYGKLPSNVNFEAVSSMSGLTSPHGTQPAQSVFMLIGSGSDASTEWALITGVSGSVFTVRRGIFDTVPKAWPAGTPVWYFTQDFPFAETTQQSAGSQPKYKVLTNTSTGQLPESSASTLIGSLNDRLHAPFRPAGVTFKGKNPGEPIVVNGDEVVNINWKTRNRLMEETVITAWSDGALTPESGQITFVEVRSKTGVLLRTIDLGISMTGGTLDMTPFAEQATVSVTVKAKRDGLVSLQGATFSVDVNPGTIMKFTDGYTPPVSGSAVLKFSS